MNNNKLIYTWARRIFVIARQTIDYMNGFAFVSLSSFIVYKYPLRYNRYVNMQATKQHKPHVWSQVYRRSIDWFCNRFSIEGIPHAVQVCSNAAPCSTVCFFWQIYFILIWSHLPICENLEIELLDSWTVRINQKVIFPKLHLSTVLHIICGHTLFPDMR